MKCNKKTKMTHEGLEPSPFTSQVGTINTEPARRTAERTTKFTNKSYPIVKNMYYNEFYLGNTSYTEASDIGKNGAGTEAFPLRNLQ